MSGFYKYLFVLVFTCMTCLVIGSLMAADTLQFTSQGENVVGKFFPTNGEMIKTVLLLQGFPGNMNDVLGLGEELSSRGYNVFTFNYRGTFESEGNYGLKNSQQDIASAYHFLCQSDIVRKYSIDTSKLVLGGYSFGGGMALTYAANNDGFDRVFAIAPTDHGQFARDIKNNEEYRNTFLDIFASLQKPDGPVKFERVDFVELLENADYYDLRKAVPQLTEKDLLIIYGVDDASVTLEEHGLPFYRALSKTGINTVDVEILQDNHAFEHSREKVAVSIANWLSNEEATH